MNIQAILNSQEFLIIIVILALVPLAGVAIAIFSPKKRRSSMATDKYAKTNKKHRFYSNNFFTRKSYLRIHEMLARLSVYNFQEVRYYAVKYFELSTLCLIGVWGVGTYIFHDFVSSILLLLFAYMMKNRYIDKNVDKSRRKLLDEFSSSLSSLREEYTRLGNIPDALAECEKGQLVQTQMEDIYNICTSVDGEDLLNEFYSKCQFRQLKTLAAVCYILNDTGDTVDEHGNSSFRTDISLIKDEVDLEVRKNRMVKIKFGSLEILPVVPIFAIRAVESFFMDSIPGTVALYNGILGYVSKTVICMLSLIGFYIIANINSEQYVRGNDRLESVDNLLKKKWFDNIVTNVTTRDGKRLTALSNKLRGCLSSKDVHYIYAEKVCFSVVMFVLAFIATILMTYTARDFMYNNVKSMSLTGGFDYTVEEYRDMFQYDCQVMAMPALPSDDQMSQALIPILKNASEFQRLEEVERIKTKYEKYHNLYYKWYYVLIAYLVGVMGWFIPEMLLKFRGFMVKTEAEEDVLQMQTIIASVMGTSLDTMSVLYWMEKNSSVHKEALLYCYHEYAQDPEMALERLKSKSTVAEFNHMCDKLISTIHQITVREAFADLIVERNHVMKLREMVQEHTIETKRAVSSPLALSPLYALAFLHILAPIGILGFAEFKNVLGEVGF